MTKVKKIINLAKKITKDRIFEEKKINNIINKSNLIKTKSDRIVFLKEYAEQYPYPNNYISNNLLKCASPTKEFTDFISWLAKKNANILQTGVLTEIYNYDKQIFETLYEELSKSKDDEVCIKLGTILGGMGQADPKQLFGLIIQKKIVEITLIGAVWETSHYHKIPEKILSIILSYTGSKKDNLRCNAIVLLIVRFHENPKILKKMIRLAKTDDETKGLISNATGIISGKNHHSAFLLLQQCSKTDNKNLIIDNISMNLGSIATDYPIECLNILKNWLRKSDDIIMSQNLNWFAEQIGKSQNTDFNKIEEFLLKWINTASNQNKYKKQIWFVTLEYVLPSLIYEIYKTRKPALFSLIKKIDYTHKNKKDVIIRIIETFFSNSYNEILPKQLNIDCHDLLEKIAIYYNFDTIIEKKLPGLIMEKKLPGLMETLALVQNIKLNKKSIDPRQAKRNLKQFPNIIKFLTKNKLHNLIDTQRNHHLTILLSRSKVPKKAIKQITKKIKETDDRDCQNRLNQLLVRKYYSQIILADLDQTLVNIKPEGTKEIKSLLLNEGFFEALMQLNMYSKFRKKYQVTLEPKLKQKKGDLLVKIEKNDYYFEIYQPKSPKHYELQYTCTVHCIGTDKLKNKIIDKFQEQLEDTKQLESPVIFVIDDQHQSATDIEIRDLLEGTIRFIFPINNTDKKMELKPYITRTDDSFNIKVKNGNLLSAVIVLRRDIDCVTLTVGLRGKIYTNPGAKFPINEIILRKIENSLFDIKGVKDGYSKI